MRRSLLILPLLALAHPALAQEAENTLVVTGEALAAPEGEEALATEEIDRDAILTAPSGRIEDVLETVAGFQQFRRSDSRSANPSAQGATLRALGGNATSRALVVLDGVPLADPFFGYIPFFSIAPERLGRISVTRGGGAGAFGAGAVSGTIALESAGPDQLAPLAAQALANDRGGTEAWVQAAPRLGKGFATLSARWDRGDGFFTTPEDQRVAASVPASYDARSLEARAVAPLGETIELQTRFAVFEDERTLRFAGADNSTSGQDASVRVVARGEWQVEALAYVQARDFSNIVISSTRFTPVLDQRKTPSTGLGGKIELRPPETPLGQLRFGVDYRRASGELSEDAISAFSGDLRERRRTGGTNDDLGIFAGLSGDSGRLSWLGLLRADRWTIADGFYRAEDASGAVLTDDRFADRSGWDVTGRAGLRFEASDSIALRAAAYRGLRVPTLNELYRPFVIFPVVTQANAALEPERLWGYEIGADWQTERARLSITAFDNRLENAVANVTLTPVLRQRRNLDAVRARGVELDGEARWGAFSVRASIAFTDAEVEGTGAAAALDGNRPPQVAEIAGGGTLAWRPGEGAELALTVRHVGDQFESDRETDLLPAATTLGAFARIPLTERLSLVLRGENLTGERIVTRNQGGSIDLGTPTTVWGGIRLSL
jgi:outer membrane receptor protein involved in Fe transport